MTKSELNTNEEEGVVEKICLKYIQVWSLKHIFSAEEKESLLKFAKFVDTLIDQGELPTNN